MVHESLSLGQVQFVVWTFRYIAVFQDRGECASVARVFIAYALSLSRSLSFFLSLRFIVAGSFCYIFLKNFLKMFLTFSLFFFFFFYSENWFDVITLVAVLILLPFFREA